MYAFSDVDFMAGQAFLGMPPGLNEGFDGWLESGGIIGRTEPTPPPPKKTMRPKYNPPSYAKSRRDIGKIAGARSDFTGCAFTRCH